MAAAVVLCSPVDASAAVRGGVRANNVAQTSVRNANVNRTEVNRTEVNRTEVNRTVDVNRNVNVYQEGGVHYDSWGHPIATAAAATATAVAVGTVVASLPPHCSSVSSGGVTLQQCGNTFYQPYFRGSSVQYVVVNPPR
jgi:hypothetical protein